MLGQTFRFKVYLTIIIIRHVWLQSGGQSFLIGLGLSPCTLWWTVVVFVVAVVAVGDVVIAVEAVVVFSVFRKRVKGHWVGEAEPP